LREPIGGIFVQNGRKEGSMKEALCVAERDVENRSSKQISKSDDDDGKL